MGVLPTFKVGAPTYYLAKFSQILHENERIWNQRGVRVSGAPFISVNDNGTGMKGHKAKGCKHKVERTQG